MTARSDQPSIVEQATTTTPADRTGRDDGCLARGVISLDTRRRARGRRGSLAGYLEASRMLQDAIARKRQRETEATS